MSKHAVDGPALSVAGLCVDRGDHQIVHDVDLQVRPGEIVALLGPNGAGKSTLLAALAGILPARAGTVGTSGRIATVLQSPALARRTALANVELALAWWGVPRGERRARAGAALELMQAGPLAARRARSLSGGQQRRIHLARAVAISPDVLLLDEPFDGLDPQTHETLRDDTARALRASGGGVVVVLHDRRDAWAMADRIVVLIDGRVHADGSPQDVLSAPPTAEVARFLGYDGELRTDNGVVLTRAVHVRVEPDGELAAEVTDRVPVEDGVRLHLRTDRGDAWARHDDLDVAVGDRVRVTVRGGVHF